MVSPVPPLRADSVDDEFLPRFDVESRHSIDIAAPPSRVYAVSRDLDMSSSPLVRALFGLRCMPRSGLRLQGLTNIGFKTLRDEPGRTVVLGLIGRFWTLRGDLLDFDPADFPSFAAPGYAKATWSFTLEGSSQTRLTTVTRVLCLDRAARQSFERYWFFVRPFSGLVRQEALRIVKRSAESVARPSYETK